MGSGVSINDFAGAFGASINLFTGPFIIIGPFLVIFGQLLVNL